MQVRMKIGPQMGKFVDLPYAAARNLVEMDQAEDVGDQMRLPKAQASRVDAATVENAAPMGETAHIAPVSPHHVHHVHHVDAGVSRIGTKKKNR